MTLSTRWHLSVEGIYSRADADGSVLTDALRLYLPTPWLDGTGANQADRMFRRLAETMAASDVDTYDLASAATDALGTALAFARVKLLFVRNTGTVGSSGDITVSGTLGIIGSGNTITLKPEEVLLKAVGSAGAWPVVGGSSDSLVITNASGSATAAYQLAVIGASA